MIDYSIIGKRFGRLVVIELDHISANRKHTFWKCKCDCGNEKVVYRGGLTSGDIISCGCYHQEHSSEFGRKHGLTNHRLYIVWDGMLQRCTNPKASNYERYGERGIGVCEEWRNDFKSFYDWSIANGYKKGLTLDRRNNNEGYGPDNCRWVDRKTQQNNTRRNRLVTFNNETKSIAEWSRILGVNHETLRRRVIKGNMVDFEKMTLPYAKELIIAE